MQGCGDLNDLPPLSTLQNYSRTGNICQSLFKAFTINLTNIAVLCAVLLPLAKFFFYNHF